MSHPSTYKPTTPFERWLDRRLPIIRFADDTLIQFPTPKNLNYWWTFGGILAICLVIQIVTGVVLAMHYTPHKDLAFDSVGSLPADTYSAPMARTWPEMIRPPESTSSIAISSATLSGLRWSGSALPTTPIRMRLVRAARYAAHRLGAG